MMESMNQNKNSYIIKKGDIGTKFYIIKSGIAVCMGENVKQRNDN